MRLIRRGGLALAVALFGCTNGADSEAESGGRRPLGKADMTGACQEDGVSYCGRKSAGNCWCNDGCLQYGDCCSDYAATCTQQESPLAQLKVLLTAPGTLGMPPAVYFRSKLGEARRPRWPLPIPRPSPTRSPMT